MRKLTLLLILLIIIFVPNVVQAQGNQHFSLLSVDIWPEYDQPSVLMIYRMTMVSSTVLPASLSVRIPSDAQINAVALVDPTKGLVNAPYDLSVQGQWSLLKFTTDSLQSQVEFYTPLARNGTTRHVIFAWAGDYAVDDLEVNFLQPYSAENVTINFSPVTTTPGQDGLTNYHVQTANLTAGKSFSLTIDYQRQTNDLSISSLPVQAVSTPGPDTQGRVSMTGVLPWVLAGIGVLLIVAGIVGFLVWQRGTQGARKVKKHVQPHEETDDDFIYCHQCGKRAQPGDVFCRTCGTRLKRGSTE
jgi:hypothetical protein